MFSLPKPAELQSPQEQIDRIKNPLPLRGQIARSLSSSTIIFIEPQDDRIVTLTIGQPYWDKTIYAPPEYDDTVVRNL